LAAKGVLHGSLVIGVNLEGVRDTGLRNFNRLSVISGQSAIFQTRAEEVDNGKRQALLGFCRGLNKETLSALTSVCGVKPKVES